MVDATTTIAGALAATLLRNGRALARYTGPALEGDVTAVHRARVSSRRLREALAVVAVVETAGRVKRLDRAARRKTRAFGPVREVDVALQELDRTSRVHRWPEERTAEIRRRLIIERARRRRTMIAAVRVVNAQAIAEAVRELTPAIRTAATEHGWWRAVIGRVSRRAVNVKAAIAACGTLYAEDRLHALRIAIKKLRYALELVTDVPGADVKEAVRVLKYAQGRLGHLHDLQILAAEVRALSAGARGAVAMHERSIILESLDRECRQIHAAMLPRLPDLDRLVTQVRREVAARPRGRRRPMAKAAAPRVSPAGTDTARQIQVPARRVAR